jgi:multiple sugar transport system substrate-binding protein
MVRLAPALMLSTVLAAPAPALAADLTIYWLKGFYPEEDTALEQLVAAYERKTGKDVELKLNTQDDHPKVVAAARAAGESPDLAEGPFLSTPLLARQGALADLSDIMSSVQDRLFPIVRERLPLKGPTGTPAYYEVPFYHFPINVHVWKSLLEQAGLKTDDIPREWGTFWHFWCDTVQPAVRKATGRTDIYGVGLPISSEASDTDDSLEVFAAARGAEVLTRDGKLLLDDAAARDKFVRAVDEYTGFYKRGYTPPDSLTWTNTGNNKAFHGQKVVMTINTTLSIPNALRAERPDDYYRNTASVEWPLGPDGKRYGLVRGMYSAVVFRDAKHVDTAKDFLRFASDGAQLGPYIEASLGRGLPVMPDMLETPFWQDQADPHRRMAAKLIADWPATPDYAAADPRYEKVYDEHVWGKAVHDVAAKGTSPEQAVDEAIARVKQILSE